MDKSESFFQNLENALANSTKFNLNDIPRISFQDYPTEKNEMLKGAIEKWFDSTIKSRDNDGMPRSHTVDDCSGMATSLYFFLQAHGIPCNVVIGDMKVFNDLEYNTSYEYLCEILDGKEHETIKYHVWVVIENFWIVDPTFRLKESEKDQFIAGELNSGVSIFDIERVPDGLEYIPMLVGMELLTATNQLNFKEYP
jgi:hypothetical protein